MSLANCCMAPELQCITHHAESAVAKPAMPAELVVPVDLSADLVTVLQKGQVT